MWAKESLDSVLSEGSKPATSKSVQERLLNSIVNLLKQNKGHKWLSNFEAAAIHLSIHIQAGFFYSYVWTLPIFTYIGAHKWTQSLSKSPRQMFGHGCPQLEPWASFSFGTYSIFFSNPPSSPHPPHRLFLLQWTCCLLWEKQKHLKLNFIPFISTLGCFYQTTTFRIKWIVNPFHLYIKRLKRH